MIRSDSDRCADERPVLLIVRHFLSVYGFSSPADFLLPPRHAPVPWESTVSVRPACQRALSGFRHFSFSPPDAFCRDRAGSIDDDDCDSFPFRFSPREFARVSFLRLPATSQSGSIEPKLAKIAREQCVEQQLPAIDHGKHEASFWNRLGTRSCRSLTRTGLRRTSNPRKEPVSLSVRSGNSAVLPSR